MIVKVTEIDYFERHLADVSRINLTIACVRKKKAAGEAAFRLDKPHQIEWHRDNFFRTRKHLTARRQ
jgi:hypothetical protein